MILSNTELQAIRDRASLAAPGDAQAHGYLAIVDRRALLAHFDDLRLAAGESQPAGERSSQSNL